MKVSARAVQRLRLFPYFTLALAVSSASASAAICDFGSQGSVFEAADPWSQSRAQIAVLLELRGKGPVRESTYGGIDGHTVRENFGAPANAQMRVLNGSEIFRHYAPAPALQSIQTGKLLRAGNLPYIQSSGSIRTTYPKLTGVFFTSPRYAPEQVGVSAELRNSYVDFKLPAGVEILELEPGIFLIPGAASKPKWITDYYSAWKEGRPVPSYVLPSLKELEKSGASAPLEIAIEPI